MATDTGNNDDFKITPCGLSELLSTYHPYHPHNDPETPLHPKDCHVPHGHVGQSTFLYGKFYGKCQFLTKIPW
jgi:hypothetical protein